VGGNLWYWFIVVVLVPVFLDKLQGIVEVFYRLLRVVSPLIAFPVYQEFISLVLASVIEYLLCFQFFSIIDKDRGRFTNPSGCESIGVILIICFQGGDVKV